jgi:hypothetical protein
MSTLSCEAKMPRSGASDTKHRTAAGMATKLRAEKWGRVLTSPRQMLPNHVGQGRKL